MTQPSRSIKDLITPPHLLTPEWTQVDALSELDPDDDEWEEDEVTYVTLDFGRNVKPEAYKHLEDFQILAPNSAKPYARLGAQIFQGRHEELVGSEILLRFDATSTPVYTPFTTTSSRITFEPVQVTRKDDPNANPATLPRGRGRGKVKFRAGPNETGEGEGEPKKKRGRPRGSKNKPKDMTEDGGSASGRDETERVEDAEERLEERLEGEASGGEVAPPPPPKAKRGGRQKGSKNKPKRPPVVDEDEREEPVASGSGTRVGRRDDTAQEGADVPETMSGGEGMEIE